MVASSGVEEEERVELSEEEEVVAATIEDSIPLAGQVMSHVQQPAEV